MKLFDSLSKTYKTLKDKKKITIYCCGPTVYDHQHLGNIRTGIMTDILVRVLRYKFPEVIFTKNITDIDDKILKRAKENNENPKALSERMYQNYLDINNILNIQKPDHSTKVTDYLNEIIEFIQDLLFKKKAYKTSDGIYFDTTLDEYNFFENKETRISRIEKSDKKNDKDFALWKFFDDEYVFDSPWGKGRPGWHIECSTMLYHTLGESITIHCGGIDLAFPHHNNEIAQSFGRTGKYLAEIWVHFNFLNMGNYKMSKSDGNIIYGIDFINKYDNSKYASDLLRYLFLSTHYSNEIKFSENLLKQAAHGLDKLRENYFKSSSIDVNISFLLEDLDTSSTINILNEYPKTSNLLGFYMEKRTNISKDQIEEFIKKRNIYKLEKNYIEADKIKEFLLKEYVGIQDTYDTTIWFFK